MLKMNKKLWNKGFSLIELMVAVTILAMVIFGIFNAYSVGFMGMVDARDRTVATNYAREAMEDIKNKDFDQIETQERSFIGVTKFEREVIVQPSTNLKKVTTKVYWKDRKETQKMVETETIIHFIETTAGTATRIILIASSYNVLTTDDESTAVNEKESVITAIIKDDKGNNVKDPTYNITFSIVGGGSLSQSALPSIDGKATTIFTSPDEVVEGGVEEVTITASTTGLTSDSVNITVTNPERAVKIKLDADPIKMKPNGEQSTITATIVNAGGAKVNDANNEITFSVSGPGTLSTPTTKIAENSVADIILTSSSAPGTITVTASSSGLEPGVVDVITGGKIYLSASPINVPVNEKSEITVIIKDVNGVPINYNGTINLIIDESSTGSGTLPSPVTFDGTTYLETVDFTASFEGEVIISATDTSEILDPAGLILTIKLALVPDHIEVSAEPLSIKVGGNSSTITAVMKTSIETGNITITSYEGNITFNTTTGYFSYSDIKFTNGIATAVLNSPDTTGTATVTACSPSAADCQITGSTEVGFYVEADHIGLVAIDVGDDPPISVGGDNFDIEATIYDGEIIVSGYTGPILFEIIEGHPQIIKFIFTNKKSTIITITESDKGKIKIGLISQSVAGTARIKATSSFINGAGGTTEIEGYLNIPVGITLDLVPGSVSYIPEDVKNIVSFDIDIRGAELILEEMKVSWSPESPGNLNKIEIQSPNTADPITIFNNIETPALSGDIIDVNNIILSTGVSTVIMYFSYDMQSKTSLDVTFNPNSGDYLVNLKQ